MNLNMLVLERVFELNVAYFSPRNASVQVSKDTPDLSKVRNYNHTPASISTMKLSFNDEVKRAIRANEFQLYYQPQIDTKTGQLFGAEALIRWHHPERGVLYPDSFIPQAEYSGQIVDIGKWTFNQLFQQQADWQTRGNELINIAVNVSGNHFVQDTIVTDIEHLTHAYRVDPAFIALELTERMPTDLEVWVSQAKRLQNIGVKISIDDFGTGYNTMAHLIDVSVDFLKIDQSFIRQMPDQDRAVKVVQSLVRMAETLGAVPIAEGVETDEVLHLYQQAGGQVAQGFYYSKAVPAEEFLTKYLSHKK
ncbi:EAL domain-containing protein [Jeotgalibacillus salarius]|uniref:EAL domain-containing protein n=1 Tax=Jeotgalibacillus salarius TaxID=546023 RepID=A0A4Y8LLL8_9BACL|nr:EAL domain-containing protein [Jeotgalibacillus salarius]TFE02137.1 EAL domain-containing protein [Jeotgalibacillus salarius]